MVSLLYPFVAAEASRVTIATRTEEATASVTTFGNRWVVSPLRNWIIVPLFMVPNSQSQNTLPPTASQQTDNFPPPDEQPCLPVNRRVLGAGTRRLSTADLHQKPVWGPYLQGRSAPSRSVQAPPCARTIFVLDEGVSQGLRPLSRCREVRESPTTSHRSAFTPIHGSRLDWASRCRFQTDVEAGSVGPSRVV